MGRQYRCENWFMKDLADAMKGEDSSGRKIVIPIFQRGKRWSNAKKEKLIDSLLLGYPVGTLLFADRGNNAYSIIDGLQRSTTICEYVLHPTKKENLKDVDDNTLNQCRETLFPLNENYTINAKINQIILDCISKESGFDTVEVFYIANEILTQIPTTQEYQKTITALVSILRKWFNAYKNDYETICKTEIPVIVYLNNSDSLHEVFERINKQGEPLTDYEIFAASWRQDKYKINNQEIIDLVIKKYDTLTVENYQLEGYDRNIILQTKELTAFEYLFGFGKYLIKKYDFLNLEQDKKENEVTAIGFELFDACLNSSKKIADLADIIHNQAININKLERRIEESIAFVYKSIAPICDFKGNKRIKERYLHPKYFVLALIAFVLNEMYDLNNLETKKTTWNSETTKKCLQHHYVFGLVNNDWHDGGIGKMYTTVKDRYFAEEISKTSWVSLLDGYFQKSIMAKETKKIANPTKADMVLLNCIYVNIFTVNDQLSDATFDIEHLATKNKMKKLINTTHSQGIPISSIANQCYLPEGINRHKQDKTIYEETLSIPIADIENKYSFTSADDFEFINLPYDENSSSVLEDEYIKFLTKRFNIQKTKILEFLGFAND